MARTCRTPLGLQNTMKQIKVWIIFFIATGFIIGLLFELNNVESYKQEDSNKFSKQCWCSGYMPWNCNKNLDCTSPL